MRAGTLAALVLTPLFGAHGQGSIRGTVYDSISRNGPVPGAFVELVGTTRRVRADERGRFEFDDVPAGRQVVRHFDLWLDSLSLPPLATVLEVRDGRATRADLATPSRAAYQRAVCGATFDGPLGLLRGEVRSASGAPAPGVFVGGVWSQAIITRGGLAGELVGSIDTTDANGMYTICGVPREITFTLRAGDDSVRSDVISVSIGTRYAARRDLVIGDGVSRTRVHGRVLTARGAPLAGAVVAIAGDSGQGVRADDQGRFALPGVPRRTTEVVVRTLGYTPQYIILEPAGDDVELADVVLEPVPYRLDTIRVNAARSANELAFLERRRKGTGAFLDSAELARMPAISANLLQTMGNGIRTTGGSPPRVLLRSTSSMGNCAPTFWIDGIRYGQPMDGFEEAAWLRMAKRLEIHRAPQVPPQYDDFNLCGVVLIWTS